VVENPLELDRSGVAIAANAEGGQDQRLPREKLLHHL